MILLILNDDKETEIHRAVDKNIFFRDSVYLFSFEQSNCVRTALFSLPVALTYLIHFRGR